LDESKEEISYFTESLGEFNIISKNSGNIGKLFYKTALNQWVFYPKNDYYYKPVIIALILTKLNILNDYKKGSNK
jgi:hypothetical protein